MKKIIFLLTLALWAGVSFGGNSGTATVANFVSSYLGTEVQVADQGGSKFLVEACGLKREITFSSKTRARMARVLGDETSSASLTEVCPRQAKAINQLAAGCRQRVVVTQPLPATGGLTQSEMAILGMNPGRHQALGETRIIESQNRVWGQVGSAFVGGAMGAWGQALRRPNRLNVSQVGGGASASATGGSVGDITNTATGGQGGQGGQGGAGYGGNTTISHPPPPPTEVIPVDGNDHGEGDGQPDDPVWPDPPEDGNDY